MPGRLVALTVAVVMLTMALALTALIVSGTSVRNTAKTDANADTTFATTSHAANSSARGQTEVTVATNGGPEAVSAIDAGLSTPASAGTPTESAARVDNWVTSLGPDDETIVVAASDERYPFCSTVDLSTARQMAQQSFPNARSAWIAADGEAMEVLLKARWLGQLERLWVCTDNRGLQALTQLPLLPRLTILHAATDDGSLFNKDVIKALVRSPAIRNIERLRFPGSDSEAERSIGSEGVIALAKYARLPKLRFLDLSWNPIDEDAVASLVRSPIAHRLEELNLCRTAFPANALIAAKLTNLSRLCVSDLVSPEQGGADRKRLATTYSQVLSPNLDWLDEP